MPPEQLQAWQHEEDAREARAATDGGRYGPPSMLESIYEELANIEYQLGQRA